MVIPTFYINFLKGILQEQQKILPSCRSLKAEDICGATSAARFLLAGIDIAFVVTN